MAGHGTYAAIGDGIGAATVVVAATVRDASGPAAAWIAGSAADGPPRIASPTTTARVSGTATIATRGPECVRTLVSSIAVVGASLSIVYEISMKMFFVSV
jgi:hypothetical protein